MSKTHINNKFTKKRFPELKSTSNVKTQSEEFFSNIKNPRETINEVKTIYNNTYQNFYQPNVKKIILIFISLID
jgi:hypothetical protein